MSKPSYKRPAPAGRSSNTLPGARVVAKAQAKARARLVKMVKPRIPEGWTGGVRILGIDPGEHTGLAYFENGQLMSMRECKPEQLPVVLRDVATMVALVIFEDSRIAQHVWTSAGSMAQRLKMARNVGEIDGLCRIIEGTCRMYGIPCMGLPPSEKAGPSGHGTKLDAEAFAYFTGWQGGRTNQHERDAALIAWRYRSAKP